MASRRRIWLSEFLDIPFPILTVRDDLRISLDRDHLPANLEGPTEPGPLKEFLFQGSVYLIVFLDHRFELEVPLELGLKVRVVHDLRALAHDIGHTKVRVEPAAPAKVIVPFDGVRKGPGSHVGVDDLSLAGEGFGQVIVEHDIQNFDPAVVLVLEDHKALISVHHGKVERKLSCPLPNEPVFMSFDILKCLDCVEVVS